MHKLCFAPSSLISGWLAQLVATTEACSKKAMSPTAEQNACVRYYMHGTSMVHACKAMHGRTHTVKQRHEHV